MSKNKNTININSNIYIVSDKQYKLYESIKERDEEQIKKYLKLMDKDSLYIKIYSIIGYEYFNMSSIIFMNLLNSIADIIEECKEDEISNIFKLLIKCEYIDKNCDIFSPEYKLEQFLIDESKYFKFSNVLLDILNKK